jgi:hypothetical protein
VYLRVTAHFQPRSVSLEIAALRLRLGGSSCSVLIAATLALAIAVLMPARADAFGTFANGVLTARSTAGAETTFRARPGATG